jgi:hypothetical protein
MISAIFFMYIDFYTKISSFMYRDKSQERIYSKIFDFNSGESYNVPYKPFVIGFSDVIVYIV